MEGVVRTVPNAVDLAQVVMIHLDELFGQLVEQEVDGMEEGDGQVEVKGEVEEVEIKETHNMDDCMDECGTANDLSHVYRV